VALRALHESALALNVVGNVLYLVAIDGTAALQFYDTRPTQLAGRKGIHVARLVITLVLAFVVVGLLWPILVRLRRGRLADDVAIRRARRSYVVPIAACVALSFVIGAALWWLGR
jgi:hypothetical protein